MRSLTVALALLGASFAGCLAPGAEVRPSDLPAAPGAYLYACDAAAAADPCAAEAGDLRTSYQEPYVAAHPTRAGVFVIGMNAGPSTADYALALPSGRSAVCQNDLLVTEDAGKTWRYVETPRPKLATPQVPEYCGGDPAHAFDAAGVLHLTGIATPGDPHGYAVYYAKSPDLGATWSEPVLLSINTEEDRNWIGIDPAGRILVVWQFFGGDGGSALAVSEDGGDSFDLYAPGDARECFTASPLVFDGEVALFACSAYAEDEPEVRVIAFDPRTRELTARAAFPAEVIWPTLAWAGDRLEMFALAWGEPGAPSKRATSLDAGRNWTGLAAADDLLPEGMPTGAAFRIQWTETDPWGRLHLIWFSSAPGSAPLVAGERAFGHSIFGTDGALLHGARISEGEAPERVEPPRTLGRRLGNHYMGMDFGAGERALLAWSERGGIQHAFVEAG